MKTIALSVSAMTWGIPSMRAVTIDTVYFAQTHLHQVTDPYFNLGGNRDTLIKAHVVDPSGVAAPPVQAVLTLDGDTLTIPLTGPATLPVSIPNGPGVVQHSFADSFTGVIPKAWVKRGLSVSVQAGPATANFNNLAIGAPSKVVMTMLDVHYFAQSTGNYPSGWENELKEKWPVAELEVRRLPLVVFPELVIPPRSGLQAARVKSKTEYKDQTGKDFDGEQAAALAWNGALKRAAGLDGRVSLYYMNIYGVAAGGQAGGFAGVGTISNVGVLHHELGHALSLPHWGDSATYPYKGAMHGIPAPAEYNATHAGPTWAYDSPSQTFIPPTTQPGNVNNNPIGTYKVDPMQGGGSGYQEPAFLMNHFSDYSMRQMRNYLEGHIVVWNESLGAYASWNSATKDYTKTVTNNGVQFPIERDVPVISIMASVSGANPSVNMVYPPIGPYTTGLIRLFDPTVAADRTAAASIYAPTGGCDVSVRVTQGGVVKTYMLAAALEPSQNPINSSSLRTAAINLPAADGPVTRIDLLNTPDAQLNGLPADPQVLYSWPSSLTNPPNNLAASGGNAVVNLTWTGAPGTLSYKIKRSTTSGGPYTEIATTSTPSFSDTNVVNGSPYYYVLTATSALSESENSLEIVGTPIPPPAVPAGLAATSSNGQITLSWNASPGADTYNLKRSLVSGGPYTTIAQISDTDFIDTAVINGVSYHYVVTALSTGSESDPSQEVSGIPVGVPIAPVGLLATGNQTLMLSWDPTPGATTYTVKRATTSGGPYMQIATVSSNSYEDTSVTYGSSYFYIVTATNSFGDGPDSSELFAVSFRPQFWDGGTVDIAENGDHASAGGDGTWDTTLTNWDDGAKPHVAWDNSANYAAVFGGTAGVVNVGADVTVGGLWFDTTDYSITPATGPEKILFGAPGEIKVSSGTATISAALAGNSTIRKTGNGLLNLTGVNTYTGDTSIEAGTLRIGNNTAGTLGAGNYAGNIHIAAGATLQIWSTSPQTLSGVISGEGDLRKAYGGSLTLSGQNTYTGKSIFQPETTTGFVVNLTSFNSVGSGPGYSPQPSSSLGAPTTVTNGTITVGAIYRQAGVNINYTGPGETTDRVMNFNFNSNSNRTLIASGSGLLKFVSNFTGSGNGAAAGALILDGNGAGEIAGNIPNLYTANGGSKLTKNGSGIWTLSGENSYTGVTTVNLGTLLINNTSGSGTGTGAVNVTQGTLGGSGSISGSVTVGNGSGTADSILSPGNSGIGTINIGSLTFNSDGHYACELDGTSGTSDRVRVNGSISINPSASLVVSVAGSLTAGQRFFIVLNDDLNLINGTFAALPQNAVVGNFGGADLKISYFGNNETNDITGGYDIVLYTDPPAGSPYETWATGGELFDEDANNDGVFNGVAFLLGAGNPTDNALGLLPIASNDSEGLVLTFQMLDSAARGAVALELQYGTTLASGSWTTVEVPDTSSTVDDVIFTITGTGPLNVTATIPATKSDGVKLFARLRAVQAP